MSNRRYPPAYLRYLKARLWNFSKPAFWGTAIFLSVLGLVIREYWSNPDAFTRKQNSEVTTQKTDDSLTDEDKAIAADIDNLPVLYNDVEQATSPITIRSSKDNSRANPGKDLLQSLISKQKPSKNAALNPSLGISSDSSVSGAKNPFITQTENLLQFSTQNSNTQLSTSSQPQAVVGNPYTIGIGVNQSQKTPYTSISSSPSILQPSSNQTPSNFNSGASTPSNALGYSSNGVPRIPNNSATSILSNPAGQTSSNGIPQNLSTNTPTVPSTNFNNVTGYIQPTVPNSLPNSYNNINPVQPLPNQVPTSAVMPITSVPTNTQPYSVQPPYPNINSNQITPPTPASYTNSNGYLRNQLPQSISVPGQPTSGVQGSGYSSPYTGGVQRNPYGY